MASLVAATLQTLLPEKVPVGVTVSMAISESGSLAFWRISLLVASSILMVVSWANVSSQPQKFVKVETKLRKTLDLGNEPDVKKIGSDKAGRGGVSRESGWHCSPHRHRSCPRGWVKSQPS